MQLFQLILSFPRLWWAVIAADLHLGAQSPNNENMDQNLDLDLELVISHLQLHADVLSVLAEFVQGADGRLYVAAVFPVDQQPDTRHRRSYFHKLTVQNILEVNSGSTSL